MRDDNPQDQDFSMGDGMAALHEDDALQWETIPDNLQEDETFVHAVPYVIWWQVYKDKCSWSLRLQCLQENWASVSGTLSAAYLQWAYPAVFDSEHPSPASQRTEPINPDLPSTAETSAPISLDFKIDVINTLQSTAIIRCQASVSTISEALVLNGYVGASPLSPAIAMLTLELYHRIWLHKPSFSAEAFAKVICNLYKWPYHCCYQNVLADCFDVYLMMRCKVDQQVLEALGHNMANWWVLNSCPPCSYELEDEPELKFRKMIVFDGNNSLSRMAPLGGRKVGDWRVFKSDYFLDPEFVDKFADEVRSDPQPSDANITTTQHLHDEHASTVTAPTSACTDNWKAARADAKKKSWGIFEETGVIVGELFKYPLSIVSKALDILRPQLLIGYDVGCKLATTISSSSLATLFAENECYINHLNVIEGIGLEDLATMERIFSHSNQLAPVIRYASVYNCRVFIDMLYRQWDEDKYLNLSNMLYGNYKQALCIINKDGIALQEAKHSLGISDRDIKEPIDPQYIDTVKFIATQSFHKSLANLQCLVIWHLFELHKLNISKTSYHMRTHVTKSLQMRCKAIQNAVKVYNEAALTLNPPAPMLDWLKVSHYTFLEEFTLLQKTRQDIRSKRWTEPAVWEVIKQSLRIEWAHEEVTRCNIEIHRLHTAIVDEQISFATVLKQLKQAHDPLYGAVDEYFDHGIISRPLLSTDAMPLHPDQDSEPGTSTNICVPSPIDDCLALENTRIMPTYPRDASAPPFEVHLPQPTPQGSSLPRSPLHLTVSTSENKTLPTCHTPGTSWNIQLECADKENEIILQDPLADIFRPNGIAKTVPAPALSPIKKTNNDGPSASNNKLAAKVDGKKKMRPGATKNAQNLCAWHWLKQVNEMSGTTEEFHMYWAALTPTQQDEYKANAERLQSAGTWTKGSDCAVCNGALY
ncbi:hypothetical protein BDR03DRAFT_1015402 [Suillus americanus]|nr:hypothetical protein BDR03DRAFT_1015402 [Suillus americanus]